VLWQLRYKIKLLFEIIENEVLKVGVGQPIPVNIDLTLVPECAFLFKVLEEVLLIFFISKDRACFIEFFMRWWNMTQFINVQWSIILNKGFIQLPHFFFISNLCWLDILPYFVVLEGILTFFYFGLSPPFIGTHHHFKWTFFIFNVSLSFNNYHDLVSRGELLFDSLWLVSLRIVILEGRSIPSGWFRANLAIEVESLSPLACSWICLINLHILQSLKHKWIKDSIPRLKVLSFPVFNFTTWTYCNKVNGDMFEDRVISLYIMGQVVVCELELNRVQSVQCLWWLYPIWTLFTKSNILISLIL